MKNSANILCECYWVQFIEKWLGECYWKVFTLYLLSSIFFELWKQPRTIYYDSMKPRMNTYLLLFSQAVLMLPLKRHVTQICTLCYINAVTCVCVCVYFCNQTNATCPPNWAYLMRRCRMQSKRNTVRIVIIIITFLHN